MNFANFERAQAAAFAYREARHTGNIDCLRAVCFVLRNRVRNGWGDGSWLTVMESAHLVAADHESSFQLAPLANGRALTTDRLLQMMVRDIDDIYLGQDRFDDPVRQIVCTDDPKKGALYYSLLTRSPRPWFVENIIHRPEEHSQVGTIGQVLLYR